MLFVCYPKCSTCRKAADWLADRGIAVETRDIKTDNPHRRRAAGVARQERPAPEAVFQHQRPAV